MHVISSYLYTLQRVCQMKGNIDALEISIKYHSDFPSSKNSLEMEFKSLIIEQVSYMMPFCMYVV